MATGDRWYSSKSVMSAVVAMAAIAAFYFVRDPVATPRPTRSAAVAVNVTFVNNADDADAALFWWDAAEAVELPMAQLDRGGGRFTSTTFVDHIWTFRRHDGQLIRSVVVDEQSAMFMAIADCTPLDDYHRRTGRAWLNIWPRDPVRYHILGSGGIGSVDVIEIGYGHWDGAADPDFSRLAQKRMQIAIKTESESPRLVSLAGFMSAAECDEFVAEAHRRGGFKRSLITDKGVVSASRTSSSIWLDTAETPLFEHVSRRMFAIMQIAYAPERARRISESFQLLHYSPNQEYKTHMDWFDVDSEESAHYLEVLKGRNRFATFFLYLSDVEEGGETAFPLAKGFEYDGPPEEGCQKGLRMRPKKGDAIIFYSMLPDGNLDPKSLHAGCPVIRGEKYAANIWFWEPTRLDLGS